MSGVSSLFGKNKAKKTGTDKAEKLEKKKNKKETSDEDEKWASEKAKKTVVIVSRAAASLVTEDTAAAEAAARKAEQDDLDMQEKLELADTKNMLEAVRQRQAEAEAAAIAAAEEEKRLAAEKEAGNAPAEVEASTGVYNAGARIAARMNAMPKPQESVEAFPDLATALKAPAVPPPVPVVQPSERPRGFASTPFGTDRVRDRDGGGFSGRGASSHEAPMDPVVSSIFGASTGERPKLKLAARTVPLPEVVVKPEPEAVVIAEAVTEVTSAPVAAVETPVPVEAVSVEAAPEAAAEAAAKPAEKKKKKKKAAFGGALDLDDLNI